MNSRILFVLALVLTGGYVNAQDPHFTQYFASPLSVNPANAGVFDGNYRVALNERKQWWNVGNSYMTTSLSADFKLNDAESHNYNLFAAGISGIFERSLNGVLQNNFVTLSGAYHQSLDYNGRQTIGLGVSFNYSTKLIDYTKLTFASQFNGIGFDAGTPVNFGDYDFKASYFDVNAGLLYSAHLDKANLYGGAAVYHINQPEEHIFSPSEQVPMRFTLNGGGNIIINEVSTVVFSGYFMAQGGATDGTFGGAYGFKLNNNDEQLFKLYVGFWYRVTNAYIPYFGFDYNDYSVGVNYSTPASSSLNFNPQSFELSLIYRRKSYKLPNSLNSNF